MDKNLNPYLSAVSPSPTARLMERARELKRKGQDIVDLAGELQAKLLVIGATGHSALYERIIGSRADRIIQLAPCPVLVVK